MRVIAFFLKSVSCFIAAVLYLTYPTITLGETVFERTFFGAHVQRSVPNQLWKRVGFGAIRLQDANVTWADLEPVKGGWQWGRLDNIVKNTGSANVDILLPLQATPTWAASNPRSIGAYGLGANTTPAEWADWEHYVAAVVRRYKGRISIYEVWNEPNLKQFFSGTPQEMAELTKRASEVIHREDPSAKVVCSSITGDYGITWLKQYLDLGAGKYCDVIGYHFYTNHQSPEKMLPIIRSVQKVMNEAGLRDKPLWNTESGWLISHGGPVDYAAAGFSPGVKVLSADEAAAYVPRSLLLAKYAGIGRFYWYSWDHQTAGLSAGRGIGWTRPARVYSDFVKIFSGSKLETCKNTDSLWQCDLQLQDNKRVYAYWVETDSMNIKSPHNGELMVIDAFGEIITKQSIKEGELIKIETTPVFVRELDAVR